jgi:flavoprotein
MLDKGETLDRLKKYSDGEKISLSIRDVQCKKIRKMKNIEKIKNVIFRNK